VASGPEGVVLVHGAWHGSWCWDEIVRLLEARGISVRTVDLLSVGADPGDESGLSGDAAAVSELLDETGGAAILVGHSYGGMVITSAAAGRSDVARLFYLAAFMPDAGESLFALTGGEPAPWIVQNEDGRVIADLDRAAEVFYADCAEETRQEAIDRLRPMPPASFVEPVPEAAWRSIPSTYVVCAQDRALPPELQRGVFAPRADEVIELQASHSPFFSQPAALVDLIATRVA
jgi:pimeloyl-ACP methyl ester carboxylesterase